MIETQILQNLIYNEDYSRRVLPFIKPEYFTDRVSRTVFELIDGYVKQYNRLPTASALKIDAEEVRGITDEEAKQIQGAIGELNNSDLPDEEWLIDQTEKFCQDKAIYNAIMNSIQILDGKDKKLDKGSIPQLLSDALGVSFDNSVGHDFFDDFSDRYEFYHKKENRLPFDLDYFNRITNGGLPNKTLNIALAGTGVGKSLFMCHCAAANLSAGKNVLYITMELAEERVAERIDANLLGITMDELAILPRDSFEKKIERVKSKTTGKLIIKEYPTASAGSAHFRHLLNELKLKKNFKPDIIYIDYLNICTSSRLKLGGSVNTYSFVKAIAEELRGLAQEFDVPIVSATQTTRSGYASSDLGLDDTSESFGLPQTADFMFALIATEELQELNQFLVKQLKNRYADPNVNRRFVVGVDRSRMKLYDVEQTAQEDVVDDGPVFDKSSSGERMRSESRKFDKTTFEGFN